MFEKVEHQDHADPSRKVIFILIQDLIANCPTSVSRRSHAAAILDGRSEREINEKWTAKVQKARKYFEDTTNPPLTSSKS